MRRLAARPARLVITAGLWPIANPAPHVKAIFIEDPTLTRAHVDFEDRLQQLLSALITGFLSGQKPGHGEGQHPARRTIRS